MALLTGFLFGSLAVVWPWKRVLAWIPGRDGQMKVAQQLPVTPADFQVYTGQDPRLLLCLALPVSGSRLQLRRCFSMSSSSSSLEMSSRSPGRCFPVPSPCSSLYTSRMYSMLGRPSGPADDACEPGYCTR